MGYGPYGMQENRLHRALTPEPWKTKKYFFPYSFNIITMILILFYLKITT